MLFRVIWTPKSFLHVAARTILATCVVLIGLSAPALHAEPFPVRPVTIIVAIFFWGTAFGGVLGMLFAIPLTAFFVTAWRLAKQKYFAELHD